MSAFIPSVTFQALARSQSQLRLMKCESKDGFIPHRRDIVLSSSNLEVGSHTVTMDWHWAP